MANEPHENPRVIYEFEGGPSHLFWRNPYLFGPDYKNDDTKPFVLQACKDHSIFREHKIIPTLEAVEWENMPLFKPCEECDECDEGTCPRPVEEVGSKGSGMQLTETLEGWFIDLGKCLPWIKCKCCNGRGYLIE